MTDQFPGFANGALSPDIEESASSFSRRKMHQLDGERKILHAVAKENRIVKAASMQLRDARKQTLATSHAQQILAEARELIRRQNEFVAILVHELRNPLSPIGMAASLLESTPNATPQLLKIQGVIRRQVRHMSRLLDDFLVVAHITSGALVVERESILLADVIEEAIEIVQWRLHGRQQVLHVGLPTKLVIIDGDRTRLVQIFSNLLINASKFTPDGGRISITATPSQKQVLIAVKDDGIGIQADLLPHLFELFTQGPRTEVCVEGGLGIGLHVVRNLVHMHGGEVDVFSRGMGQGSTFTVTLPLSVEQILWAVAS
jgi:two-component system, sensor histidine kinase